MGDLYERSFYLSRLARIDSISATLCCHASIFAGRPGPRPLAPVSLAGAGAASAHTLLVNPPPLTADDNAKSGPCGCYFGGGPEDPNDDGSASPCPGNYPKTDLVAGSEITVSWKETVNHDGSFRLAISNQPVDAVVKADLNAGVIYDKPDANNTSGATITAKILVPETPCESCTLQLRQTMNGSAKPYYWSCAAIRILPAGGATTGAASTSSGVGGGSGEHRQRRGRERRQRRGRRSLERRGAGQRGRGHLGASTGLHHGRVQRRGRARGRAVVERRRRLLGALLALAQAASSTRVAGSPTLDRPGPWH
jgi:hypothetical protein